MFAVIAKRLASDAPRIRGTTVWCLAAMCSFMFERGVWERMEGICDSKGS